MWYTNTVTFTYDRLTYIQIRSFPHVKDVQRAAARGLLPFPGRVAKMYIYSLTGTNGLRFKWRITDVRRNERSHFAVHFGEDFWTCAIWLRHQGSRRSSRGTLIVQVCSASVRGEYTRERVPMRRYHCLQWFTKLAGSCQQTHALRSRPRADTCARIRRRSYPGTSGLHRSHRPL